MIRYDVRDPTITNKRAIHAEKVRQVLEWLIEFRYSDLEILQMRLGDAKKLSTYALIRSMLDQKLIDVFYNSLMPSKRLFVATSRGLHLLGIEENIKPISISRYRETSTALHHLLVQQGLLQWMTKDMMVQSEFGLEPCQNGLRPDAQVRFRKNDNSICTLAFELERSPKSSARIFDLLLRYYKSLKAGKYQGVAFMFVRQTDLNLYERHLNQNVWPIYTFRGVHAKAKRTGAFDAEHVPRSAFGLFVLKN